MPGLTLIGPSDQLAELLADLSASVRDLLDRGDLVAAARREAEAADRDGFYVTAELLRKLADAVEGRSHAR